MCCKADIRQCPNCKTRNVEKVEANHKFMKEKFVMRCTECHHEYCWSCMTDWESHQDWYMYCPELSNSMCCNIAVSILAIVFMPFIMCLAPLIYVGIQFGCCWSF